VGLRCVLPKTPYQRRQLSDSLGVSFRFSRHGFHMLGRLCLDSRQGPTEDDTEQETVQGAMACRRGGSGASYTPTTPVWGAKCGGA
jgi:hypothetical protein